MTERDDDLLTVAEVARKFDVTPYTIRQWIRDGKIKALKPGGHWRIERGEFKRRAHEMYGGK